MVKRQTPKYLEKMLFVNYKADQALERRLVELSNVSRTRMMELKRQRINVRNEYRYIRRGTRSLPAAGRGTSQTPIAGRRAMTPSPSARGFYDPLGVPLEGDIAEDVESPAFDHGHDHGTMDLDQGRDDRESSEQAQGDLHGGRQRDRGGHVSRRDLNVKAMYKRNLRTKQTPVVDFGDGPYAAPDNSGEETSRSEALEGRVPNLPPGNVTSRSEPTPRMAASSGARGAVLVKNGKKFFPAHTPRQRPFTQGGELFSAGVNQSDLPSEVTSHSARPSSSSRSIDRGEAGQSHEGGTLPPLSGKRRAASQSSAKDAAPRQPLAPSSGHAGELPPVSAKNPRDIASSLPLSASYTHRTSAHRGPSREPGKSEAQAKGGQVFPLPTAAAAQTENPKTGQASGESRLPEGKSAPLRKDKHVAYREEFRSGHHKDDGTKQSHSTRRDRGKAVGSSHHQDHRGEGGHDEGAPYEFHAPTPHVQHHAGSTHPMHEFLLAESRRAADVIPALLMSLSTKDARPAPEPSPEKAASVSTETRQDGLPDMLHIGRLVRSIKSIYAEISENKKIDLLRSRVSLEDLLREVHERARREELEGENASLTDGTYMLLRRKLAKLQTTPPALPRLPQSARRMASVPRLPTLSRGATSLDKPDPILERNMRAQLAEEDRRMTSKKVALERVHYDQLRSRVSSFLQTDPRPRVIAHDDGKSEVSV